MVPNDAQRDACVNEQIMGHFSPGWGMTSGSSFFLLLNLE